MGEPVVVQLYWQMADRNDASVLTEAECTTLSFNSVPNKFSKNRVNFWTRAKFWWDLLGPRNVRNWGSCPFIFSHTKLQNQIQNQQTLYSTQITNSLVTLNFIRPISLSPNARPSSGSSVPLLPSTRFSRLAWDSLGKTWENVTGPETLGNDVSQSPNTKTRREYPQNHLFTNTLPHHHIHQYPTPFSQTQNLPATPKSSVQEKRVRIFGNQPYSMRLSILRIFDLLVSRILDVHEPFFGNFAPSNSTSPTLNSLKSNPIYWASVA
jgi:hypothetical protein